jgi:uncharacterized protein YuzE
VKPWITYDGDADALYVYLSEEQVAQTVAESNNRFVDLDAAGRIVGIEVLDVSSGFELTDLAERYGVENELRLVEPSLPAPVLPPLRVVDDQLEQASIGVAEVDARAGAATAAPLDRTLLDLDAVPAKVLERPVYRARPDEAEVAVSRADAIARDRVRVGAGPVHVELLVVETVGVAPEAELNQLRAEHVPVEGVRALPVGDGDHAVVEPDALHAAQRSSGPKQTNSAPSTSAVSSPRSIRATIESMTCGPT